MIAVMLSFAADSSSVSWVLLVPEMLGLLGWLAIRGVYPRWRARHDRRVLVRARQQALVDPGFGDGELLATCHGDLAAILGDHRVQDVADGLVRLFGNGPRDWLIANARRPRDAVVTVAVDGCDVVRVLSRGQDGPARVVVSIAIHLTIDHRHHAAQAFWTMTRFPDGWTRTAIENAWDGRRHLEVDPLASPEADVDYLNDRAIIDTAEDQRAPTELVKAAGDVVGRRATRTAALDLSEIDARFSPDVIESCVRRLLLAWEAATNGQPHALDRLATTTAARQLLAPARGLPRVIREPELRRLTLAELDASASTPTVSVLCSVRAHPDIWHLDVCWQLALSGDHEHPWQLANALAAKDAYYHPRG
jgi:hypothetical protein